MTARVLAEHGADVVIAGRNVERLAKRPLKSANLLPVACCR